MATQIAGQRRARFQERALQRQLSLLQSARAEAPWLGYVPDLPPGRLSLGAASRQENLHIRAGPQGEGELLINADGFTRVDPPRIPLPGATLRAIVHLTEMLRTNSVGVRTGEFDLTPIAVTAGTAVNDAASSHLYRISPGTAQWTEITYLAGLGAAATANRDGVASFQSMPQSCIMPAGAPSRAVGGGAIAEPCLIYTNNLDNVYVFPAGNGLHTYQELVDPAGALGAFKALSVASWEGRVFFLNTQESGADHHNQRVRWSPLFDANPLPAGVGSGSFDIRDLQGEGLRLLPLGPYLVAYFTDGVAFIERTGLSVAPHRFRLVTQQRGLLGPHAVCPIDANRHFCICTDGWFILDSSGRFQEIGVANVDGAPIRKWKETFYNLIDQDNLQRLQCFFAQRTRTVRISVQLPGVPNPTEVWVYDVDGDRVVSVDGYSATCWGEFTIQTQTAAAWSAVAAAWDATAGIWGDYGARFGQRALIHGHPVAAVYVHDASVVNYDGAAPDWIYESSLLHFTSPRYLKTGDRVFMEYVNRGKPTASLGVQTQSATESGVVATNQGNDGEAHITSRHARLTGQHLGITASGGGPVAIQSFELDYFETPAQERV